MPIHEQHRRQRTRNLAVALTLIGLVVLFFMITIAKMSPGP
ncbi:MAG: hypothetical protein QF926_09240 [Alphaproteobacteria bacterium]|nr:hypothetical protein [Alphaproteobacteria bacterium]